MRNFLHFHCLSFPYVRVTCITVTMSELIVLYDGFSVVNENGTMDANCSCVLLKGSHNIIIDTMTPWDTEKIKSALEKYEITPDMIHFVISTHGHSDHTGNNNLFLKAKHIVGFHISFKEKYYIHPFDIGIEYVIDEFIKIIPTPGHTLSDVTVLVTTKENMIVAVTGDLFEKFEDINDPNIWKDAGSEDPVQQILNRSKIADLVDWIVPGHGPKFQMTENLRNILKNQIETIS